MFDVRRGVTTPLGRCAASALALWAAAAGAAPTYRIAEVPAVDATWLSAEAINDQGVVVGNLRSDTDSVRVFRWREGQPVEVVPLANPKYEHTAVGVDHLGAVAYSVAWQSDFFPGKHLRTEVLGQRAPIAKKLPGVYAFFGNDAGDLVIGGDKRVYGLRERDGTLTEINAPVRAWMHGMNNHRQVVGVYGGRPIWWSRATGLQEIPALQDEPMVAATAVNDRGDTALMTGPFELSADDPDNAPNKIALWNAATGVQAIGQVPGCTWYRVRKLNAQATMVGDCFAEPSPFSEQHAFAWTADSGPYLLESQIDPADPLAGKYQLQQAVGVNRSGQVLAQARRRSDGSLRVLVLTPVPVSAAPVS